MGSWSRDRLPTGRETARRRRRCNQLSTDKEQRRAFPVSDQRRQAPAHSSPRPRRPTPTGRFTLGARARPGGAILHRGCRPRRLLCGGRSLAVRGRYRRSGQNQWGRIEGVARIGAKPAAGEFDPLFRRPARQSRRAPVSPTPGRPNRTNRAGSCSSGLFRATCGWRKVDKRRTRGGWSNGVLAVKAGRDNACQKWAAQDGPWSRRSPFPPVSNPTAITCQFPVYAHERPAAIPYQLSAAAKTDGSPNDRAKRWFASNGGPRVPPRRFSSSTGPSSNGTERSV